MFARRGADPRRPKARTVRWLAWLAGAMTRQGQTVFYLERLQPEWLPTPALRRRYALTDRLGAGLGAGLLFGLLVGLGYGLVLGLGYGLLGAPAGALAIGLPGALAYGLPGALTAGLLGGSRETRFGDRWRLREIVRDASLAFLAVGLAGALAGALAGGLGVRWGDSLEWLVLKLSNRLVGELAMTLSSALAGELPGALVFGLAGALAGALAGGPGVRPRHIAVVEALRWSFSHARSAAAVGLLSGLAGGLVFGLLYGLAVGLAVGLPDALSTGLAGGLVFGLLGGLVFGLVFGLAGALARGGVEDETKAVPNQGIRRSAWAAVAVGLAGGLLSGLGVGLVYGLLKGLPAGLAYGVGVGLAAGLAASLVFGGYACLSHAALRLVLWRSGALPLDCVRFLDSAADRILLRKVGGGYLFVHRLLQEHFAALGDAGLDRRAGCPGPGAAAGAAALVKVLEGPTPDSGAPAELAEHLPGAVNERSSNPDHWIGSPVIHGEATASTCGRANAA